MHHILYKLFRQIITLTTNAQGLQVQLAACTQKLITLIIGYPASALNSFQVKHTLNIIS